MREALSEDVVRLSSNSNGDFVCISCRNTLTFQDARIRRSSAAQPAFALPSVLTQGQFATAIAMWKIVRLGTPESRKECKANVAFLNVAGSVREVGNGTICRARTTSAEPAT